MTDVVTHAEIKRTQAQLAQLQADIAAARLDIADVQVAAAGSVIKSIQRGVIYASNTLDGLASVTVSPVAMNKSVLLMSGVNGRVVVVSGGPGVLSLPVLSLVNATTVQAVWLASQYGVSGAYCGFQLVEYY